jgi:hypothetical protein
MGYTTEFKGEFQLNKPMNDLSIYDNNNTSATCASLEEDSELVDRPIVLDDSLEVLWPIVLLDILVVDKLDVLDSLEVLWPIVLDDKDVVD